MTSFLTEMGGFTPVMDVVTEDVGLMTAIVFGLVWRHCQMKDKVCNKSVAELAEMLELSTRTVRRHLDKLCEKGYIKDTTPDLRNRPHTYILTGKVEIIGKVEAALTEIRPDTESQQEPAGVTESHSQSDTESQPLGQRVTATVTQSPMNKTWRPFKETGDTETPPPVFSKSFQELAKKAITAYSETSGIKLDKTQAAAITDLIKADSDFNLPRWVAACTSTKLGGVKPENVQCRLDTYKAGGNYQVLIGARRNGNGGAPDSVPKPVPLDETKRRAYQALQAEAEAAAAETNQSIEGIVSQATQAGIDVQEQIRKARKT